MRHRTKKIIQTTSICLAVFIISFCIAFIALYIIGPHKASTTVMPEEAMLVAKDAPSAERPVPISLRIDSIGVGATVKPVGLTEEGDMAIDDNNQEVAWYQLGQRPGEEGSAVMAGHYGWKNGVPSVFNKLNELEPGDEITAVGKDLQQLTFVVTRIALYDPQQDATEVFTSNDKKAHLNLITCQGSWDKQAATYDQRLVVFSTLRED